MPNTFNIWGSKHEIEELKALLKGAGFNQIEENYLRASEPNPERDYLITSISYQVVSGIGQAIKAYLRSKRKMLVTREDFTVRWEINGDWTPDEIERAAQTVHGLTLQNAPDQPPEPTPSADKESGMGFGFRPEPPKKASR